MPAIAVCHHSRRPQLECETPLVPLAAAETVIEEASQWLSQPLPRRYAPALAHRARRCYAHGHFFRRRLREPGDRGRDWLYCFLRHWLAARLQADRPHLYARLPLSFSAGKPAV
ncbi:MAG: hypothetical protein PHE83_07170 [Opitutaceae bacterium]|nr:hypothetical protein [Opitutaceae bacterium]